MKANFTYSSFSRLFCPALVAASMVGCSKEGEDSTASSHPSPIASKVKNCPDGHATLKNVPISYGLLIPDEKTKAAVARQDFWPGGCVFGPGAPTNAVVCTTCGLGSDNNDGWWSGSAQSLSQFKRPFSSLMASFPVPATNVLVTPATFSQAFTSNRIVSEGISFQTTESFADVAERVDAWFAKQKLKPMRHSSTNQSAQVGLPRQSVRWKEMNVNADLNLSQDGQISAVSVSHSRYGELSP